MYELFRTLETADKCGALNWKNLINIMHTSFIKCERYQKLLVNSKRHVTMTFYLFSKLKYSVDIYFVVCSMQKIHELTWHN